MLSSRQEKAYYRIEKLVIEAMKYFNKYPYEKYNELIHKAEELSYKYEIAMYFDDDCIQIEDTVIYYPGHIPE